MLRSLRRAGAGRGRRKGAGPKLALALVTCLNLALSRALALHNRLETLRVLRDESGALTLLAAQKETKTGKTPCLPLCLVISYISRLLQAVGELCPFQASGG